MHIKEFLILCLLAGVTSLILTSLSFAREPIRTVTGTVTKISDGDTIHVTTPEQTILRVPKGRITEDGTLSEKYLLQEMPTEEYSKRTEQNILDSDGTLIISQGQLTGGSALTEFLADTRHKPYIHVDMDQINLTEAAEKIQRWIEDNEIQILNVAGPRASKDSAIYRVTMDLLEAIFPTVVKP